MTIYIPKLLELPGYQMAQLDATAKYAVRRTGGRLSAYVYEWPDLRVIINVMPDAERPGHLEQFVRWIQAGSHSLGRKVRGELTDRIRSTTIVLGFAVEKATHREVWDGRVQDMIGMICFNTKALVFWEGMLYDENCMQVWPAVA